MAKARSTAKASTPTDGSPERPVGSQADYDAFLPAASRVSAAEIIPMRADPSLALHNVRVGVASVLAERPRLAKLPETDVAALEGLERLALAVVFANMQILPPAPSNVSQLIARGVALRGLLLQTAEALALAELLPRASVDAIRAGRGRLDAARDLVALSALFAKNAPGLRGKHAVSATQVKEAAELGTELLKVLKPSRAPRGKAAASIGADQRDRLWTLLVQGWDRLWRAGAYLFGRDVDAKVPALQASRGGRGKKKPAGPAPA